MSHTVKLEIESGEGEVGRSCEIIRSLVEVPLGHRGLGLLKEKRSVGRTERVNRARVVI